MAFGKKHEQLTITARTDRGGSATKKKAISDATFVGKKMLGERGYKYTRTIKVLAVREDEDTGLWTAAVIVEGDLIKPK